MRIPSERCSSTCYREWNHRGGPGQSLVAEEVDPSFRPLSRIGNSERKVLSLGDSIRAVCAISVGGDALVWGPDVGARCLDVGLHETLAMPYGPSRSARRLANAGGRGGSPSLCGLASRQRRRLAGSTLSHQSIQPTGILRPPWPSMNGTCRREPTILVWGVAGARRCQEGAAAHGGLSDVKVP